MRTSTTTMSAALVAGAVLCLLALSAEARGLDLAKRKDAGCDCATPYPAYQLLRGADQAKQCESGYYCDCAAGKQFRCINTWIGGWKFNEDAQVCELRFDCKAFFQRTSTVAPTTEEPSTTEKPTTTTPALPTSCDCGARTSGFQLIRGEQQVALCKAGYYCNCATAKAQQCTVVWGRAWNYDENAQKCSWGFDCEGYDYRTTTTTSTTTTTTRKPTTTTTTTKTPSTMTPAPFCSSTAHFELIRGDEQVSMCQHGYYKDCVKQKVDHCFNLWGFGWMFNEEKQACQFMQNCQKFFEKSD